MGVCTSRKSDPNLCYYICLLLSALSPPPPPYLAISACAFFLSLYDFVNVCLPACVCAVHPGVSQSCVDQSGPGLLRAPPPHHPPALLLINNMVPTLGGHFMNFEVLIPHQ